MYEVNVVTYVGPICTDPEHGAVICDLACEQLALGKNVTLNFEGVTHIASAFLNSAIGCIFKSLPSDMVLHRLNLSGLDEIDNSLVLMVIENAVRFYSADSNGQERLSVSCSSLIND
jgi:hypothetical protein